MATKHFTGGYTEDFNGADIGGDGQDGQDTHKMSVAHTRKKAYADYVALSMQWAGRAAATLDGTPASYQANTAMIEI